MSANVWRIVGPPGTGKTTTLADLARRAAAKHGGAHIAIVSMTRTAAAEIGGRDSGVPDTNCSTLHAACYRALDTPDLAETPASMREFLAGTGAAPADDDPEDAPSAGGTHAAVMNHRARMTPPEQWTDEERDHHAEWQDFCTQTGRVDFTTLIERGLATLDQHPAYPRVLMIDEAQDLSRLELALAMKWSAPTETTVIVGDSQQCLYGFRGSDPENLDAIPAFRRDTLKQSYRCPRAVHEAATAWVRQLPGDEITWQPRDSDGQVDLAPYALRDTEDVVHAAVESVGDGQSTMILASCRYMLTPLVRELRAQGIPFANPWAQTETAWNPLAGKATRAVRAFWRESPNAAQWTWGQLHDWTEPMSATHLPRGAKAAITEHVRTDEFGQTRAADEVPLGTLATLLGEAVLDAALAVDVDWWEGTLLAKHAKAARYPVEVLRRGGIGALTDAPRLTVGSVHSVKGATVDHVLLSPDLSKVGYWESWLGGGKARDAIVRMGYVAMTRARETLTIMEPGGCEYAPIGDVLRDAVRA